MRARARDAHGSRPRGDERYTVAQHCEAGVGLARVGFSFVGSGAQVVWNHDQTRCLVMEGELYDLESLTQALSKDAGDQSPIGNQADLLLRLNERCGLNGRIEAERRLCRGYLGPSGATTNAGQ